MISISRTLESWSKPVSIAPLATFRMLFGIMMLYGIIRFASYGWIEDMYIMPGFHFSYYGFEWLPYPPDWGVYALFILAGISAIFIAIGLFYRYASILFFLSFTYIELLDRAYYLNHYYFVSCAALLMIFMPANKKASLDVKIGLVKDADHVPRWSVDSIKLMLCTVYFFAGLAKLNYDWLFEAQPLAIWLPQHSEFPVLGSLFTERWMAYAMSWGGAIFDLSIPFLLWHKRTVIPAYVAVAAFHILTGLLFPIGIFPGVMMASTLIFFPVWMHQVLVNKLGGSSRALAMWNPSWLGRRATALFLVFFFAFQFLFPFRYLLYPGNVFWTEQGYRFSWRVMLMEKAGMATFFVKDPAQPGEKEVKNGCHLTAGQEKQMSTQPDMILQYAQYLSNFYQNEGIENPSVRAEVWVTLNGSGTRLFLDPKRELSNTEDSWAHKSWINIFETSPSRIDFSQKSSE